MDTHPFTFPSLCPSTGSNPQPYVRLLIFITKKKDIEDEMFHKWWRSVHADLAIAVEGFGRHCGRYVQMHTSPAHKASLARHGMEPLPFDGMGEMHVKSLDDWVEFQRSPALDKMIVWEMGLGQANRGIDGANFMKGPVRVILGWDHLIYGSASVESGGRDGILPGDGRLKEVARMAKL
ncbi:hypothetical protein BU23DRAFT_488520 [Bimuria novae-zelandiae CBS 107.79]|uniref:EthD domain-containing protein n=1 Tax=Bimuria novae-zelandiae CBS 107.79 TaxID=1447943 RepID=A0A6A5UXH7_9PLEO|nr:hypothetical protein BU23DRAFT_488520 [Bimuria novae-zelandiae CBS 107.79]